MASNFIEHKSAAAWKRFFSGFVVFSTGETDLVRRQLSLSLEKVLVSDCVVGCSVSSGEEREGLWWNKMVHSRFEWGWIVWGRVFAGGWVLEGGVGVDFWVIFIRRIVFAKEFDGVVLEWGFLWVWECFFPWGRFAEEVY